MPDGATPNTRAAFAAGAAQLRRARGNSQTDSDALTVHRYPSNIGSQEVPHYVMFFITKRTTDIAESERVNLGAGNNLSIDVSNRNSIRPNLSQRVANALTTGAGVIGGGLIGKNLTNSLAEAVTGEEAPTPIKVAAFGAGAVAGGVTTATSGATGGVERTLLKKCIALYLSGKPSASYTAIWQDKDIGVLGAGGALADSIGNSFSSLGEGEFTDAIRAAGSALQTAGAAAAAVSLANAPELPGKIGDLGALVSSTQGFAINPFKAQLFQNMGFRTFSFEYVFLPKNEAEYKEVQEIIKMFKKYMHPSKRDGAGLFLGYPAEFSMAYYYGEGENAHIHKIGNCALTNLKVEYGGTDFITFKNSKGAPAEIGLQLQFTELEILTDKSIEDGY